MTEVKYVFDRLGADDVDALVALESECFSHPWGAEQFRLGLERKVFYVFGLRQGDALAAYCSLYLVADEAEILNIAVRPGLREAGLGSHLLGMILQISAKMGMKAAHLEVRASNVPAQRLYAKFGFEQVGVRPKYYPDTGEDAFLMTLDMEKSSGRG
ncbi:ribosomal protein S18-alanine N-acetyltransferase [Desulfobaculum senezii]